MEKTQDNTHYSSRKSVVAMELQRMKGKQHGGTRKLQQIKTEDGKLLADVDKIIKKWKQCFEALLNPDKINEINDKDIEKQQGTERDEAFEKDSIGLIELEQAIDKIKIAKAPSIHEIAPKLIKSVKKGDTGFTELMMQKEANTTRVEDCNNTNDL
ncbi:hypothetical protein ILUMI_24761 [Ignelater luminosus]|uniref:Uncharacterized protein n=1 Tax=Ignelater luminosus TaxID=2038154 RepID=A0A8K0C9N1_IGNLU|nr:hypothetical protein ILUMI_24761 [Ignelater luminosus]